MTTLSAEDLVHRIAVLEAEKAQMAAALEGVRDAANRFIDDLVRADTLRDQLVAALRKAEAALSSCYDVTEWPCDGTTSQDEALNDVRAALAAAGAA